MRVEAIYRVTAPNSILYRRPVRLVSSQGARGRIVVKDVELDDCDFVPVASLEHVPLKPRRPEA